MNGWVVEAVMVIFATVDYTYIVKDSNITVCNTMVDIPDTMHMCKIITQHIISVLWVWL